MRAILDALRALTTAVNEQHYAKGEIVLITKAAGPGGVAVAEESPRLPISYQSGARSRFDQATGTPVSQPRFLVLQSPLRAAMADAGVTQEIGPSANLGAFLFDEDGAKYDAGQTTEDDGGTYWSIDVRQVAGPPPADTLIRRIIFAGVPLLTQSGASVRTKG